MMVVRLQPIDPHGTPTGDDFETAAGTILAVTAPPCSTGHEFEAAVENLVDAAPENVCVVVLPHGGSLSVLEPREAPTP